MKKTKKQLEKVIQKKHQLKAKALLNNPEYLKLIHIAKEIMGIKYLKGA